MRFPWVLLRSGWCWLWLVGLLVPGGVRAQGGMPPARYYLPTQYNAHSQNFALAQDGRGVLYVGNFAGVLEYDGLNWRTIPTTDITKVSALRLGADGRLYVGANGEFGYLRPDSTGRLAFASLSRGVRTRFNEVLAVLSGADRVFFVTRNVVFDWDGQRLRERALRAPAQAAFQVGAALYVFQASAGLSRWRAGGWQPVALAPGAAPPEQAAALLPLADGSTLLATRTQGLYRLAGNTLAPLPSTADAALQSRTVTAGAVLRDRSLVLGTAHGDLLRLRPNGQLAQLLAGPDGLEGQLINALLTDREGGLWLALNNGLAQLELPSPLTLFSQAARHTGEINDVRRVGGRLYVAASNGLFELVTGGVRAVPAIGSSASALAGLGRQLYVGTSQGLFRLVGARAQLLAPSYVLALAAARRDSGRLYVGTDAGLGVLTARPGQAPRYQAVPGLSERVFGVQEDATGGIWLETLKAGLYRYAPATGQLTHFAQAQGLPTQLYNRLALTSQGLLACNDKGIFRFDSVRQRFAAYSPLGPAGGAHPWLNDLVQDAAGDLWAVNGNKLGINLYRRQGAGYVPLPTPFRPLATSPINVIYPDQRGVVWLGGRDGLLRYDERVAKTYDQPFAALLRLVETVNGRVLYAGAGPTDAHVVLPPKGNDISFEFAAATYPVTRTLSFQYQLENYDAGWSEWSAASKKEYTNLPAGDYRFRVRARNVYGTRSREATYRFQVGAPWWAQWWALALFGVAGAGLVYWLVRWRLRAVVQEKQNLESLIEQRTEEVVSQKAELEEQSEELAVKNDQLEKIDLIVQAINADVDATNLFQNILAQFSVIRNMNSASFLVYDEADATFGYQALRGPVPLSQVAEARLTLAQAEARYLSGATEIYENIYLQKDVRFELLGNAADELPEPKSLVTLVLAHQGRVEGFITLENTTRAGAFDQRDLSMMGNLKEHLIAAFIKTRLLQDIEHTLHDLKETQGALVRQERLASVGQLTKGIADRIQNPLNYVKNFTESSNEILADVLEAVTAQQAALPPDTYQNLLADLADLRRNATTVLEHSNSTTRILSDMKRLLREKSREFLETDLNTFVESRLRTVQQELRPEYKDLGVQLRLQLSPTPLRVRLLPYELGEALQVIVSNAYYAMQEKSRRLKDYAPVLDVRTQLRLGQLNQAELRLRDNGKGITPAERTKLFSPFFTTKPTSRGTGLGLFMSKDILEAHGGSIDLLSQDGEFTELVLLLPLID